MRSLTDDNCDVCPMQTHIKNSHTRKTYTHTHTQMHTQTHTNTHTHTHTNTHTQTHTHTLTHTHSHTHTLTHTHAHKDTHRHRYTIILIYRMKCLTFYSLKFEKRILIVFVSLKTKVFLKIIIQNVSFKTQS